MLKKRVKEWSAVALALALAFSAMILPEGYAANAVDTNASCSIEFAVGGNYEELKSVDVPLNLYKIASVNEVGSYQPTKGFESIDLSSVQAGEGAAADWMKRAENASKLIQNTAPAGTTVIREGKAKMENLSTGLYLVMAEEAQSDYYGYTFTPYLISLPNNYFEISGDDTWVYDLTGTNAVGLKPEQTERVGSVAIQKELVNQNVTYGGNATFVFQLDITTLKGDTDQKMVALSFDSATTKTTLVENIPAGSTVTVTEVYGSEDAGYQLSEGSDRTQTVTVAVEETVQVSFRNEVSDSLNGGYGVVNNFTLGDDTQYRWNVLDGNAAQ